MRGRWLQRTASTASSETSDGTTPVEVTKAEAGWIESPTGSPALLSATTPRQLATATTATLGSWDWDVFQCEGGEVLGEYACWRDDAGAEADSWGECEGEFVVE